MEPRFNEYTNAVAANFGSFAEIEAEARTARAQFVGDAVANLVVGTVNLVKTIAAKAVAWQRHQSAVAELAQLDDRLLADLGLSRSDIAAAIEGNVHRGFAVPANVNTARTATAAANAA